MRQHGNCLWTIGSEYCIMMLYATLDWHVHRPVIAAVRKTALFPCTVCPTPAGVFADRVQRPSRNSHDTGDLTRRNEGFRRHDNAAVESGIEGKPHSHILGPRTAC